MTNLIGNDYGNVEVVFSAKALEVFVEMLNRANICVDGDFLNFRIDEYTRGRAQLLVAMSSTPNDTTPDITAGSLITSIEEVPDEGIG